MHMRLRWDANKRQIVLKNRQIDLAQLENLQRLPYIEDQRADDPDGL
jgi:uncharacterized DUF497 family protein